MRMSRKSSAAIYTKDCGWELVPQGQESVKESESVDMGVEFAMAGCKFSGKV